MKPELSESPRIAGVPEPTVDDFRIADKTFDLDPSDSPKGSPRHGLVRFGRASIRAETGREKYDLLMGIRPPRNPVERIRVILFRQDLTEEQENELRRAETERPVDLEMLEVYFETLTDKVEACSRLLGLIQDISDDDPDREVAPAGDTSVDTCIAKIKSSFPLFVQQMLKVADFIALVRAQSDKGPARIGTMTSVSASGVAISLLHRVVESWEECRNRSCRAGASSDHRLQIYAARHFVRAVLSDLPRIDELMAWLDIERAQITEAYQQKKNARVGYECTARNLDHGAHAERSNLKSDVDPQSAQPKSRIKRHLKEPGIAQHLSCRPHDTIKQTAVAVGCSDGVVCESLAWNLNQQRLSIALRLGVDPKGIPLDESFMTQAGGNLSSQRRKHRERELEINGDLDAVEAVRRNKRIAEFSQLNPGATNEQIAKGANCTIGDIEHRDAELKRLATEQNNEAMEDTDTEDSTTKRGMTRKWVKKKP